MRILFVQQDTCLYGASRSLLALIDQLKARGHESFVLLPRDGPIVHELRARGVLLGICPWRGCTANEEFPPWRRVLSGVKGRMMNRRTLMNALDMCMPIRADIVHTNSSKTAFGAMLAQELCIPHTWHFREFLGGPYTCGAVPCWGRALHRRMIKRSSTAIVYVSNALRSYYNTWLSGITGYVVYNGVSELVDIRQPRPFPAQGPVTFAMVGRLEPLKQPFVAVEALRILRDRDLRVRLLIAGGGEAEYVRSFETFVRDQGVGDQVEMLGQVGDVREVYAASHAVLMCSVGEAFGRVTAEAMACRRPVIGADAGATSELIHNEVDGLLFRPNDPGDLAEKIHRLAIDRQRLRSMGESAAKKAQDQFSVEKYGESMERVFLECLQ